MSFLTLYLTNTPLTLSNVFKTRTFFILSFHIMFHKAHITMKWLRNRIGSASEEQVAIYSFNLV